MIELSQINKFDEVADLCLDANDVIEVERLCPNGNYKNHKKTARAFYILDQKHLYFSLAPTASEPIYIYLVAPYNGFISSINTYCTTKSVDFALEIGATGGTITGTIQPSIDTFPAGGTGEFLEGETVLVRFDNDTGAENISISLEMCRAITKQPLPSDFLLQENGDFILLESGDKITLE